MTYFSDIITEMIEVKDSSREKRRIFTHSKRIRLLVRFRDFIWIFTKRHFERP